MEDPTRVCSRCGARYGGDVIFCPKDGTPLGEKKTEVADDPYIGIVLAEQFRIEQLIGIGAMGRVYRAHQRGIERPVAVKIIHRDLLRNPTVMSRFQREARVASRLSHPNVVSVLTTGEIPKLGADVGGEAYLVMEYLDGISLRSALAASGNAMPLPRALHVVLQVCDAVGEAHAQGIVHRDVKPENVMLIRRGDDPDYAKVLDFGVARIDSGDGSVATQAGVIFGTARYISPEGAQGKTVGPPSDVYSIGCILFQCLSGQTPFDADNPVGILIKHTNEPAPDVRSIARSSYVPEPIATALNANLSKNPSDRCRDGRELGRALIDAVRASGISPDDVLMRSSLLRSSGGALQLQSLQRTKSLALTPALATQLSGNPTHIDDDGLTQVDAPTPLAEPTSSDADSINSIAVPSSTPPEPARPSHPSYPDNLRPSRPSGVEPTLADEPVSELVSNPGASAIPPPPVSISSPSSSGTVIPAGPPSSEMRPSFPDSGWAPAEPATSPVRRWLLVAACFLVGAALAIGFAHRMGAFAPPEPTAASYTDRARTAMAREAWDEPPGENVRDITDGALRRWPGAKNVIEVRENAARSLVQKARTADLDRGLAVRWAKLATSLDPKNEEAQSLLADLTREDPEPAPSESAPAPPASAPNASRKREPTAKAPAAPAPAPPAAPAPAPGPKTGPGKPPTFATPPPGAGEPGPSPTPSGGGRWL